MPVTPGWKLWGFTLITVLLASLMSIGASVRIADRNTERQLRIATEAKREAAAEQLKITCNTIEALIQAYAEIPPSTPAGKNVQQAYIDQYRVLDCQHAE